MTAILPAPPRDSLAGAAWIPTLVIWHPDGRLTRLEGEPCADYAAALAASWRLRPAHVRNDGPAPLGVRRPGEPRATSMSIARLTAEATTAT